MNIFGSLKVVLEAFLVLWKKKTQPNKQITKWELIWTPVVQAQNEGWEKPSAFQQKIFCLNAPMHFRQLS